MIEWTMRCMDGWTDGWRNQLQLQQKVGFHADYALINVNSLLCVFAAVREGVDV